MKEESTQKPIRRALWLALCLWTLGSAVPLFSVSPSALLVGTIVVSVLSVVLPIFLIFAIAEAQLRPVQSILQLALGIGLAVGCSLLASRLAAPMGITITSAVAQIGVVAWASAIGVLAALLFKDRNLVIPAATVLAAIDLVIVLTPSGIVHRVLQSDRGREVFEHVAYHVPSLGRLQPAAFVGPADFLFVAMFFSVVHRHNMNRRNSLIATAIALAIYLVIVLTLGDLTLAGIPLRALPALLPIGVAVLAANWNQFNMSRDEKLMTLVVALLAIAFVAFAFARGTTTKSPEPSRIISIPAERLLRK